MNEEVAKQTGYPKRGKGYYKMKLPNYKHRQALNMYDTKIGCVRHNQKGTRSACYG